MHASEKLPSEHRYKYTFTPDHYPAHSYSIVCREGAIEFNVTEYGKRDDGLPEFSGGLEIHYREPPDYMAKRAPSHDKCHLIGQPCWHDGTSLYASEVLIPRWEHRASEVEVLAWLIHELQRFHPTTD